MPPDVQDSDKSSDERLKAALAGQYNFSIENCLEEAWVKTTGFKRYFWGAFCIIELIILILVALSVFLMIVVIPVLKPMLSVLFAIPYFILEKILMLTGLPIPTTPYFLFFLILILILPLFAGFLMMCILYVSGQPIRLKMIFEYFHKPLRYWLAYLWVAFVSYVTLVLGLITALYFAYDLHVGLLAYYICIPQVSVICLYFFISYIFAMPLLADRKLTTWQALETSRKAVTQHLLKVSGFLLLIFLATELPLFAIFLLADLLHPIMWFLAIVYFWLTPFLTLSMAILYRDIFGVASSKPS